MTYSTCMFVEYAGYLRTSHDLWWYLKLLPGCLGSPGETITSEDTGTACFQALDQVAGSPAPQVGRATHTTQVDCW